MVDELDLSLILGIRLQYSLLLPVTSQSCVKIECADDIDFFLCHFSCKVFACAENGLTRS